MRHFIQNGDDGAIHPIQMPVPGTITDLSMPDYPLADDLPHFVEEIRCMHARIQHAVILPQQLIGRIPGYRAEFVIHKQDIAGKIGFSDDRSGIHCAPLLLICKVLRGDLLQLCSLRRLALAQLRDQETEALVAIVEGTHQFAQFRGPAFTDLHIMLAALHCIYRHYQAIQHDQIAPQNKIAG
ncbi:hypothetical protein GALL_495510 [mine drainage metagenome]|uniref:Uncharacterized protein n=1 Tax=mine drainage metagenome TaxID=410659 RepID=A0A1J5PBY1_9ZZZZ